MNHEDDAIDLPTLKRHQNRWETLVSETADTVSAYITAAHLDRALDLTKQLDLSAAAQSAVLREVLRRLPVALEAGLVDLHDAWADMPDGVTK